MLRMRKNFQACVLFCLVIIFNKINSEDDDDGLMIDIISKPEDCDETSKIGDYLKLHYIGTLNDGTVFDSSYSRKKPFQFVLGAGKVIKGWDEGLQEMCIGEKRKLTIPPELAYGKEGLKSLIPPGSTLTFVVELVAIDTNSAGDDTFAEIDSDRDGMLSQDEVSSFIRRQEVESGVDEMTSDLDHNTLVADIFRKEDIDKDGFVSAEEFFRDRHEEL